MADGREFTDEQVAKFRRLRLRVLETDPYDPNSPQMDQFKAFITEHRILLGQEVALEKAHDKDLGPDFFKRPPWTK